MSKYTTAGLMVLSAGLITFFVADGLPRLYAFSAILTFLSGFLIGGGVGLKEGTKQLNRTEQI
jgi:hypothetical protein